MSEELDETRHTRIKPMGEMLLICRFCVVPVSVRLVIQSVGSSMSRRRIYQTVYHAWATRVVRPSTKQAGDYGDQSLQRASIGALGESLRSAELLESLKTGSYARWCA